MGETQDIFKRAKLGFCMGTEVPSRVQGRSPPEAEAHILTLSCTKIQDLIGNGAEPMAVDWVQSAWQKHT